MAVNIEGKKLAWTTIFVMLATFALTTAARATSAELRDHAPDAGVLDDGVDVSTSYVARRGGNVEPAFAS